jgi:hypothetical protein
MAAVARRLRYQTSRGVTALGMRPAAAKMSPSAAVTF